MKDTPGFLRGFLLDPRDDDNQPFAQREVRDETLTLILSGRETTAGVMTWAVAYMRDREDLWETVRAEAEEIMPAGQISFIRAELSAPITGVTCSEALRLAPPVWVSARRALKDIEVAGVMIPRGAHVIVFKYVSHLNPEYFEAPDQFRPERWVGDFEKILRRGAYFTFGVGMRKCFGDQFALLEAHIIVMEMARGKRIRRTSSLIPAPERRATYRLQGGVSSVVVEAVKVQG